MRFHLANCCPDEGGITAICDASTDKGCGASIGWAETESEAVVRWNRRADDAMHSEIERLKAKFDPEKFAHRPDCCGPDIDTHCLGCAMAESNKGDMEVAALTIKIARLTGENSVLRDLLRDALEIVASEEDWTDRDWSEFANALAIRIIKAINGLGAWVSDGAEVSDGAAPETKN
jgi:hypothetical protein